MMKKPGLLNIAMGLTLTGIGTFFIVSVDALFTKGEKDIPIYHSISEGRPVDLMFSRGYVATKDTYIRVGKTEIRNGTVVTDDGKQISIYHGGRYSISNK